VSGDRARYAPELDAVLQLNRATGNVIRGALYAMRGVPNISGPPTPSVLDSGAFGSAIGLSASWDALGLMQRMALVDVSLEQQQEARAETALRRLSVAFDAADVFLGSVARAETVKAAQASHERAAVFARTVKALADQELRPGADLARAEAERALASTQLIRAEQAEVLSRIALAEALGIGGRSVQALPGSLLNLPRSTAPSGAGKHPAIAESEAAVRASVSRERASALQYLPRLDVVASLWLRGSGYETAPVAQGAVS
jgi:outer membrane protein TolC